METLSQGRRTSGAQLKTAAQHVPPQQLSAALAEVARTFRAKPFEPHALFRGGHAQTIFGSLRPTQRDAGDVGRRDESRVVTVETNARVLLKCRWQKERREAPTILLLHGLEGSTESPYVRGTARKAFDAGFNVVRMNMRNCGDTEHLSDTLYNSGMTGDILRVLVEELEGRERLKRIFVAGYSMSGNMVLRLAGDLGSDTPPSLKGVAAVSPSIDLYGCAAAIENRANALYRWSFMRSLRRRVRRKSLLNPALYDTRGIRSVRTIRQFDERYTAPHGGYRDADDYYARASSLSVISNIRVPALILHALDDPIIPAAPFLVPSIASNPDVLLVLTEHGGHVGFVAAESGGEDLFWAENRVVEFCRMLGGD